MKRVKFRSKHGPEWKIQRDFVRFLKARHWHVERMVGNMYQSGVPDIYIAHKKYGDRWVDLKNPTSYEFTRAQIAKWPIWDAHGIGIWIITCNEDYPKLFKPPNWRQYWKDKYDEIPTREELIRELEQE